MRTKPHHHPCQRCGKKTECGGIFEQNVDGFPEIVCPEFHLSDGTINRDFICEACDEADERPTEDDTEGAAND